MLDSVRPLSTQVDPTPVRGHAAGSGAPLGCLPVAPPLSRHGPARRPSDAVPAPAGPSGTNNNHDQELMTELLFSSQIQGEEEASPMLPCRPRRSAGWAQAPRGLFASLQCFVHASDSVQT